MEGKAARPTPRPRKFGYQHAVDRASDRMFRVTFGVTRIYAFVSREGFVLVFESGCCVGEEERAERVFAEEKRRKHVVGRARRNLAAGLSSGGAGERYRQATRERTHVAGR